MAALIGLEVQCALASKTESETKAEDKPKTATGGDTVRTGKGAVRARYLAASNRRVGGRNSKKASRVVDPAFARSFATLLRHCFSCFDGPWAPEGCFRRVHMSVHVYV